MVFSVVKLNSVRTLFIVFHVQFGFSTMQKSERVLPKPPLYKTDEVMTEEDWDKYFEYRKHDRYLSDDENFELVLKSQEADEKGDKEKAEYYAKQIMGRAGIVKAQKDWCGFKSVMSYNLYDAKRVYPDEF